MNNAVTSKDKILKISKNMVLNKGFSSFSMRAIAIQCGIAVGSIYNYFPSKADLLSATIESVWEEIFAPIKHIDKFDSFVDCISCMFETIKSGDERFPGFFSVHSLNFASEDMVKGKQMMENYFGTLKAKLIYSLKCDTKIKPEIFLKKLSMEIFVDYIFMLMISTLLKKQSDCYALLELIENCIY